MNAALIFAGGTGKRMNLKAMPKQFLECNGKAIIIHTIEHFEKHDGIDCIVVVCLESYIGYLKKLIDREKFQKVKWIVPGGSSGQESIYNGLKTLHEHCPEDTVVLIHDGVRPLINEQTITDNIQCVREKGCCVTVSPAIETIIKTGDNNHITDIIPRSDCSLARAPQSFYLKDIFAAHERSIAEGRQDFIDSASMMTHYGHPLFTVLGPAENIKITTPSDFYIFRSYVEAQLNEQIFGV